MSIDRPADSRVGVAVVDPRPAERGALVTAIRKRADLELVSEAASGLEASDQISRLAPDVAVIALHVLGFDGVRVLEGLKVDGSETRVLILSADRDGPIVYHAIEAGAVGCLLGATTPTPQSWSRCWPSRSEAIIAEAGAG